MPEGDWQTWQAAIKPYWGKEADKYFHCPSAGSPEETVYVLVRYDNAVPVTLIYVPFDSVYCRAFSD